MRNLYFVLLIYCAFYSIAQDTARVNPVSFSAYIESYYCYDFGNPTNHARPTFFYCYNRHNEVNVNVGYIKVNYVDTKVRGNFALMGGTYAQSNLAAEPSALKNIYEANAGFKLLKHKNVWLDAGIFASHIGFESAIGKDCWNLTRSMLADNSPYYEAGVKLGYTSNNQKIYFSVMYLNGWQRMQKVSGNQSPAFGTQLTCKPKSNITFNWSTYVGNDFPDSLSQWRFFNNLYSILEFTPKIGIIAGFDIGMQQKLNSPDFNSWYSPVIIVRYKIKEKLTLAARGEYYNDEKGVIISTGTKHGFQTYGYSLNMDYLIRPNVLIRIEGRGLKSKDEIFTMDSKSSSENYFVTSAVALSF